MAGNDIIGTLPELKWRGLKAPPYEVVTFEFNNELATRAIPYLDGEVHDFTGRKSFPMTARLFFLNSLGANLFPAYWEQWKANLDGEIGELVHPVLGPLPARVVNARGEIRATVRAGIIVDITWVETITDPNLGDNFLVILQTDPGALADALDTTLESLGVAYPVRAPGGSFTGAWQSVRSGGLFSPDLTVLATVDQILNTCFAVWDVAARLTDPGAWVLRDQIEAFWDALKRVREQAQRAVRPTSKRVMRVDTTLDAFARDVGNSLNEVMSLNLAALRAPFVPRGTTLLYYASR